ncbi:IS3 family transposase [Corynebacterium diphtheriae]|uniref:IS3 family transposase n=1 Tax=Corynebacterium diphtheriae TaxID=1717 RepID=UPI0005C79C97
MPRNKTQGTSIRKNSYTTSPDLTYFASVDEFYRAVDDYIFWYNNARLQQRFKGLTPMQYRNQTLEGLNHLELNQSNFRGLVQTGRAP